MTLTEINPDNARDDALRLLAEHLAHYAVSLSPIAPTDAAPLGFVPPSVEQMRLTTLGYEAWALAHYALTGQDGETTNSQIAAEYARDRILSVSTALDASPWHGCQPVDDPVCGPVDSESWPTTAIGVVALAAWARIGLAEERHLTTRELAAVAGLGSANAVRVLISRGELARDSKGVAPQEARRWLTGRGVPGVATR